VSKTGRAEQNGQVEAGKTAGNHFACSPCVLCDSISQCRSSNLSEQTPGEMLKAGREARPVLRNLEDDRVKAARHERCVEVLEHCVLTLIALKPADGQCNATASAQAVALDEV
jgi:plasmid stability protein